MGYKHYWLGPRKSLNKREIKFPITKTATKSTITTNSGEMGGMIRFQMD